MNITKKTLPVLFFSYLMCGCLSVFDGSFHANSNSWRPPVPAQVSIESAATGSRPLRSDDVVDIIVMTGSSAPMQTSDVVDTEGCVTLPLLGEFSVGGLTTSEAEKAISEAYVSKQYFKKASVTLVCKNMLQEYVIYVTGAVVRKGSLPYKDGITLWQGIVAAGDRTPFGSDKVKLVRNGVTTTYSISKIQSGREPDPVLLPNDMVEVVERWL